MPDTLKQFYNATINVTGLTGAQTAPLFTNNATTRAVIKDIDVASTFPVAPSLTVGGTTTAALNTNLTGSEIVDVSQAVGLSFASPLVYGSTTTAVLTSASTQSSTSVYNINGTTAATVIVDQALPALDATATFSTVVYYAPDGDVFSVQSNGNNIWFLFKNAGSAGGTRTTINTGNTTNSSCIAFDGVNTFYWVSSTTNLRAFNADTETTTNTTLAALNAGGTQSRLLYSNGNLLWAYNQNVSGYLIEISTGRWALLNGVTWDWDVASSMPGFFFDTSTRVPTVLFFYAAGPNIYYRYAVSAIPVLTAASVTLTVSFGSTGLVNSSFAGAAPMTTNTNVVLTSADGGIINAGANLPYTLSGISGASSGWSVSAASLSTFNSSVYRPRRNLNSSPTVNTTNFPNTISLRITGVEVTP